MGDREAILLPRGYEVTYRECRKYRGSVATKQCIAMKDGVRYFAFKVCPKVCPHDHPDHYHRIQRIQASIPRMARMVGPIEDVVLLEEARGQLLWELETAPDPAVVESQLIEFALGTQNNRLIHGDVRPWNVFFDNNHGIQVIDWWCLSSFVDDLLPRGGLPPRRADLLGQGHYVKFHPDLVAQGKFTEIDLTDAKLIGRLLRGEIELSDSDAWRGDYRSLGQFHWR
jgi:hypothetical protein